MSRRLPEVRARAPRVAENRAAKGRVPVGMDRQDERGQRPYRQSALACGGCAMSALGTTTATLLWSTSSRTRRHLGGGFEGEGTDYTVLATELPLVAMAGALIPALACLLVALLPGRRRGSDGDDSSDLHA